MRLWQFWHRWQHGCSISRRNLRRPWTRRIKGRYLDDPLLNQFQVCPPSVGARLHKILGEAREAQRLPWEATRASLYRTIFPQMTLWLPEDEGAQLRFEFETELVRLEAA